jgi:hypothetical protein
VITGQKVVTPGALAAAFTEWDRRYREDPEGFDREYQATSSATEYGARAAEYLLKVLRSQGGVATLSEGAIVRDPVVEGDA